MPPLCPAAAMLARAADRYGCAALATDAALSPERMREIRARGWSLDAITAREVIRLADALKIDMRDLGDMARGLS